jgi:biopolymer transport protein ExbB/TolQ
MPTSDIYTYISATLHMVAQVLLIPVMIALAALIIFALHSVGSLIMETFTERRHFRVNSPVIIKAIHDAEVCDLEKVIRRGHLLKPQCTALITVIRHIGLDEDELFALARTEIEKVNDRYKRMLSRSEQVTKIAPMLGLMCTLIPLGPGIVAMGQGNVAELSMSLLIAFDGTVAGLVAAVVAMIVTGIRKRWYANYLVLLESLMTAILSKAQNVKVQASKAQNVEARVSKVQNVEARVSKAGESQ